MPYLRDDDVENEFDTLITLMAEMITAQARAPQSSTAAPQWAINLNVLSMKLFKHMCSARTLLEPCSFRSPAIPPHGYIDHSSIAAITRSSVENYLVMHWLFSGGNESTRDFNHLVWMCSGWKKRNKIFATTHEGKAARQSAENDAANLWLVIQASPHYEKYNKDQIRSMRKGNWNAGWQWSDLAREAGLHHTYFASIYPYLSGYTHSDYISCLQIGQAQTIGDQYMLGASSVSINLMILGHFSAFYADIYPSAKAVLEASKSKDLASKWRILAENMNFLYENDEA